MEVPNRLYQYQSFKDPYHLENLSKHQIWLANPKSFNDFYDSYPPMKIAGPKGKQWIPVHQRATMQNKIRVACFCERNDNIQMWSHYADQHRGFCIEFDTTNQPFSEASKVHYCNNPIEVDATDLAPETEGPVKQWALHKSTDWEKEEEWRIIHPIPMWTQISLNGEARIYDPNCISAIYLGAEIGPGEKNQICDIVKSLPFKTVFKMIPSVDLFRLRPERIVC